MTTTQALFEAANEAQAAALQARLASRVVEAPLASAPRRIAGVDIAVDPADPDRAVAAAALWDRQSDAIVETALAWGAPGFPYAPGLLAFRETPLALQAARKLGARPDLWLYDGNGRWHTRRFGAACHFGVALDAPTVGVAKTAYGAHPEPGSARGSTAPIEGVALALRSRAGAKPIFVSVGHRVTLDQAAELTLACCLRFRQPEPIRAADHAARQALR